MTVSSIALLATLVFSAQAEPPIALEALRLPAISSTADVAVFVVPGEGLQTARVGDTLLSGRLRVIAIDPSKVVVEEEIGDLGERNRVRTWIEPTGEAGGRVRIRRLRDRLPPDVAPRLPMPRLITFNPTAAGILDRSSPQEEETE